ncbi:MAG: hypothetical protein CR975_00205 [Gammaproteobacteria bacterium]|nr:MAG: hypothetical protein CR975_00205 [Gammaproteobacteria bacterium]
MKIPSLIKQHPILSAIISIIFLTVISAVILRTIANSMILELMIAVWTIVIGIAGVLFVIAAIIISLKSEGQTVWTKLLLGCLWVLLVGGGTCGGFLLINLGWLVTG